MFFKKNAEDPGFYIWAPLEMQQCMQVLHALVSYQVRQHLGPLTVDVLQIFFSPAKLLQLR